MDKRYGSFSVLASLRGSKTLGRVLHRFGSDFEVAKSDVLGK